MLASAQCVCVYVCACVFRSAKSHELNERSSRSHCLVKVAWMHHKRRLHVLFVDLAGSERVLKSGVQGMRLAEVCSIDALCVCFVCSVCVCLCLFFMCFVCVCAFCVCVCVCMLWAAADHT